MARTPDEESDQAEALIRAHWQRVERICRHRLSGMRDADIDDAIQETFLRFCSEDPAAIENAGGWLSTVASRVCNQILARKYDRHESARGLDLVADDADPQDVVLRRMTIENGNRAIRRALSRLSRAEQRMVILKFYAQMPYDNIASLLGLNDNAAHQLNARALGKLRRILSPSGNDDREFEEDA